MAEEYPDRRDLRELTAQSYFSFSMAFVEDSEPDRASLLYQEGWRMGREFLETVDWFKEAEAQRPLPGDGTLAKIDKSDVPLLFWTLANWMRWVSLNLDDPAAGKSADADRGIKAKTVRRDSSGFFMRFLAEAHYRTLAEFLFDLQEGRFDRFSFIHFLSPVV